MTPGHGDGGAEINVCQNSPRHSVTVSLSHQEYKVNVTDKINFKQM